MTTQMRREYLEAPDKVATLLRDESGVFASLTAHLREQNPVFVATIARGSSDHAATYAAHLFATINHRATASLPPSIASLYDAKVKLGRAFALAISQSGASPDLIQLMRSAKQSGAIAACLVNQQNSLLSHEAAWQLPQCAGPEISVAATKTVICSMSAIAFLSALWAKDDQLLRAIQELPGRISQALEVNMADITSLDRPGKPFFVIGRGPGLAIAGEAALKLKETAAQPAHAYSPAELQHGPKAAIDPDSPLIFFEMADAGGADTARVRKSMQKAGFPCLSVGPNAAFLPLPAPLHPALDGIVALAAFYPFAEQLALARGLNPDQPRGLKKVTKTI